MADFVALGIDLAFQYRNPAMILTDGAIGQMMEKVKFSPQRPRKETIEPWATTGKTPDRERNIITSVELDSAKQEAFNFKLVEKYNTLQENEVRLEKIACDDAEYLFVAYGTSARICQKAIEIARDRGLKVGLLRPITLFPFPVKEIQDLLGQVKGILSVEMSTGQLVIDVRLAVEGKIPVEHYGRMGGIVTTPTELVDVLQEKIIGG